MQSEQWSRLSVVAALTTVAAGVALLTLYPTPKPLPDRLAKIDEEDVQIDNDGLYADYDWWHAHNPLRFANAARIPFFLGELKKHFSTEDLQGVTILDVGCGGGLVTEEIARQSQAKLIGLDLSRESIEKAKKHATLDASRLDYVVGSAFDLPFADASIDAVVCSDVFEHLLDVPRALQEIARVLRSGGVLVYDTINRTMFAWYGTIVVAQNLIRYIPDHAHDWRLYITPQEMISACHGAGLRHAPITSIRGMRPTLAYAWTIVHRLAHGAGAWSLFDDWTLTSVRQASYISSCTKP